MNNDRRLIIFGANGRVGLRVTEYALEAGYEVTAFVRRPSEFPSARFASNADALTVIEGDVLNPGQVSAAVQGHDAIVTTLSVRGFRDSRGPFGEAMNNIIAAASEHVPAAPTAAARRLIYVAASGILDDPGGGYVYEAPDFPQVFVPYSQQHLAVYEQLKESPPAWTVVCPSGMPDGERTGRYRLSAEERLGGYKGISVEDVADFIVRDLGDGSFVRRRVSISYEEG